MRALVSTDLHSSPNAARVVKKALPMENYDVHICLGDIITFRPMEFLEDLFADPPLRCLTVPGNCDTEEARRRLAELGHDVHFRTATVGDVTVAGAGGCNPPPFRTAFQVEESEYEAAVPGLLPGAQVLALHGPAHGWLDEVSPGVHVGSRVLAGAVRAARTGVVLSGHIHQDDGMVLWDWASDRAVARERDIIETDLEGRTLFMNPGPAKDGLLGDIELAGRRVRASVLRL